MQENVARNNVILFLQLIILYICDSGNGALGTPVDTPTPRAMWGCLELTYL